VVSRFKIFYVGREEDLPRSITSRASEGEHRFVTMTAPNQGFFNSYMNMEQLTVGANRYTSTRLPGRMDEDEPITPQSFIDIRANGRQRQQERFRRCFIDHEVPMRYDSSSRRGNIGR
jgi:hypothetical protein